MTVDPAFFTAMEQIGVPLFVARAAFDDAGNRDYTGGHHNGGFWLPKSWQKTPAGTPLNPQYNPQLDALCVVTGHTLDVLDIDAHKNGWDSLQTLEAQLGELPPAYAVATTPSGGAHLYIRSLGVRSRDGILPGLDLKAGDKQGRGRGFVYAPPTQKLSKTTGELAGYTWQKQQYIDVLHPPAAAEQQALDALAALVASLRGDPAPNTPETPPPSLTDLTPAEQQRVADYCNALVEDWRHRFAVAADWPDGETDELGRGWDRLVADAAYEFARLTVTPASGVTHENAETTLRGVVGPQIAAEIDVAAKWAHKHAQTLSGSLPPVFIPPSLLHRPGSIPVLPAGEVAHADTRPLVAREPGDVATSAADTQPLVADATEHLCPTAPPVLPDLPEVFDPPGVVHPRDIASAALIAAYPRHRYSVTERCWYVRVDTPNPVGQGTPAGGTDAPNPVGQGTPGGGTDVPNPVGPWHWRAQGDSAHEWARHILYELETRAPAGVKEGNAEEQAQYKRREQLSASGSRGGIAALMRDGAPSASNGAFRTEDIDADRHILWAGGWPWELRCPGGRLSVASTVDLLTVHEHSANVLPRENIPTPKWDALLAAMFPAEEMRAFAVHLLGASVTGESDRILPFLHGSRGHAKTTLLELVAELLGSYAGPVEPSLLGTTDSTSLTFARMELRGLRLAWVDEGRPESSRGFERLKALVGAQTMRGARKGKDSVVFECTHTLWVTDNKDPALTDPALADRIRALNVTQGQRSEIAAAVSAIKQNLKGWVRTEGPGVLAQLILAAGRYLADRSVCDNPPQVAELLHTLTREQDTVLSWIDEHCSTGDGDWTLFSTLWAHYREYADRMGVTRGLVGTAAQFRTRLDMLGIDSKRTKRGRERQLKLRQDGLAHSPMPWGTELER